MKRLSIAIDMDEVLADTSKKIFQTANELGYALSEDKLRGNSIWDSLNHQEIQQIGQEINKPGFFRDLEVIESAVPVVQELNEHYDIYIATAAMEVPHSFMDKFEWLQEHFPFLNHHYFIFCGNKKVVQADFLIDDTLTQLDAFTSTGGTGILYKAYHNEGSRTKHIKVNNWMEIHKYFKELRASESKDVELQPVLHS
ncbi:5'(3')-deoxyribonucleotidase [Gracilibacillus halotolerans]|uniref:5'(3')-deoxyribonucleotidase n=1 Tax=Gracilibacillus halotolerans TaxID=74386 RepID=A0A841RML4_9BACI|nr:5'(3')-deoxyribonucleotidase [Gracilibacillus halotolerans]